MRIHVKPPYQPPQELALGDVNAKLAAGVFDGRELAWIPGLAEWTVLERIPGVARPQPPPLPATPPPLPLPIRLSEIVPSQPSPLGSPLTHQQFLPDRFEPSHVTGWRTFFLAAHPQAWRRFWARLIDVGIARFFLELSALVMLLTTGLWPPYETQPFVAFTGTFVVWVLFLMLYETVLLSVFGSTIGKAIFRIHVVHHDGSRLSFGEAFARANKAIGSGMFYLFAFPGVTFCAFYRAYKDLVASGSSSWDLGSGSVVRCRPVSVLLYGLGVVLAISALVGYIAVREYSKNEFRRLAIEQILRG